MPPTVLRRANVKCALSCQSHCCSIDLPIISQTHTLRVPHAVASDGKHLKFHELLGLNWFPAFSTEDITLQLI